MASKEHETIANRLASVLMRLNQGEKLDPEGLAKDFGVNLRTVQRDLNERFAFLPLEREAGRYFLPPSYLGKFTAKDITRFAALAGVAALFPGLGKDFLRELFDAKTQEAFLVKGHNYEDLSGKTELFSQLKAAIVARKKLSVHYERQGEVKIYSALEPYKLLNQKGIWYLAAKDGDRLKTFVFSRLERVQCLSDTYAFDPDAERLLHEEQGIWFSEDSKEVVLQVRREVAGYFKRRKLIANQQIDKELEDGDLIISARIGHHNQILPIVRYWLPHIRIISPQRLQEELEAELAQYLGGRLASHSYRQIDDKTQ